MADELEAAQTLASSSATRFPLETTRAPTGPRSVLPRSADAGVPVEEAGERYRRLRSLGAGGMGEVFLAEDQDIGRRVALKRLLHQQGLPRFVQEIRTVGRLEHPNIVPIHDVGLDAQGHFFVMKYVEGETLREIISRLDAGDPAYHRRFSFDRRLQIFVGLLHALQFAHSRGILHRDLKPENVMVGRFGEVMLMDWGVAKVLGESEAPAVESSSGPVPKSLDASAATLAASTSLDPGGATLAVTTPPPPDLLTRAGDLLGTPAYMSPEQVRAEPLDARSDLYSACVVLHELLLLRHYLGDETKLLNILNGVMEKEVSLGSMIGKQHPHQPGVPAELIHFLRRGLQKDPACRFQTALEMIERLGLISQGQLSVQCVITLAKRGLLEQARLLDRHPVAGVAVQLLVLGLLGLGAVQLVRLLLP